MDILNRTIYKDLKAHVFKEEISIIIGSRQVGKTTLLKSMLEDFEKTGYLAHYFTLERQDIRVLLDKNPLNIYSIIPLSEHKKNYVFIDEIQYLSDPTNFLKLIYDEYRGQIKLVVTGSSAFYIDQKFKDSLAGRKRIFHLSPFSFKEFLLYKQDYKTLEYLEQGILSSRKTPLIISDNIKKASASYIVYGGYPKVVLANSHLEKEEILNDLVYSFLKKDAIEANIRKEAEFMLFVEVLADRIGGKLNRQDLSNICGISDETVQNYLYILNKSFHISFVRPFWRSKASELRKMPKVYFQDNGLRNAIMHDFSPLFSRKDKGELVENLVYNMLRKHYSRDQIQYWNTRDQNEVDFILNKQIALEVKYNGNLVKDSKYKLFRHIYPEIDLHFACLDNIGKNIPLMCI